jgi:hypothetical protein
MIWQIKRIRCRVQRSCDLSVSSYTAYHRLTRRGGLFKGALWWLPCLDRRAYRVPRRIGRLWLQANGHWTSTYSVVQVLDQPQCGEKAIPMAQRIDSIHCRESIQLDLTQKRTPSLIRFKALKWLKLTLFWNFNIKWIRSVKILRSDPFARRPTPERHGYIAWRRMLGRHGRMTPWLYCSFRRHGPAWRRTLWSHAI